MIRLQPGPYQHASEVQCSGASVDDECIKTSDAETPELQVEQMEYPCPGESDSESSSGESEITDDEVLRVLQIANDVPEFVWKEGCSVFQNMKTKTLHLLPAGVPKTFLCGRELNSDCEVFRSRVFPMIGNANNVIEVDQSGRLMVCAWHLIELSRGSRKYELCRI